MLLSAILLKSWLPKIAPKGQKHGSLKCSINEQPSDALYLEGVLHAPEK